MKRKIVITLFICCCFMLFVGYGLYNPYHSGIYTRGGYTHDMVGKSEPHAYGYRGPVLTRPNGYYIRKENRRVSYQYKKMEKSRRSSFKYKR